MKNITIIIGTLILLTAFGWTLKTGIERGEKAECLTWQSEATQFAGYFLTKWQADQCAHYNIKVEAPIKTAE